MWCINPELSFTAATVTFSQSVYNVKEDSRFVQLELFLSYPSSANITVELLGTDGSATGDQYTICVQDNNNKIVIAQEMMILTLDRIYTQYLLGWLALYLMLQ